MYLFKKIFVCLLICSILTGCASVESLINKGEYEKAYNLTDDKSDVIDQIIEKGHYSEAMHLLSKDYNSKKNSELVDLFIKNVKVESYVSKDYGNIARDAYKKISFDDYDKKWTLLNMCNGIEYVHSFLRDLISKKGFKNLTTESDNIKYKKYVWANDFLKHRIESLLDAKFNSHYKEEEKNMKLNALNNISNILVKYKTSKYKDEWSSELKGKYYSETYPLIDVVIGATHYLIDGIGIVETTTYNLSEGHDFMCQMNAFDANRDAYRNLYGMTNNKDAAANLALYASKGETMVYFENIINAEFIKELIEDLKKDYQ